MTDLTVITDKTINKEAWPEGPWKTEPDFDIFTTASGMQGMIWRMSHSGCLNGYVLIPEIHPAFEQDYDSDALQGTSAHGGLTFAGEFKDRGIQGYWIGFDTDHYMDFAPGRSSGWAFTDSDTRYRDWEFVKSEVEALAAQLQALIIPKLEG